jgi:tetratricopeptide (TPR) repeat protein
MQTILLYRLKTYTYSGLFVLSIILLALAGCATEAKVKAPVAQEILVEKEPSVMRLTDGREGFVITEIPKMDERSRKDFDRAVTLLNDQNYVEAISIFEKIIEQSPVVTAPYIDIAIAYEQVGKTEEAEENLKKALELFPGHPVATNEYALLYRRTGRFVEAREMYEKTITSFPEYYPSHKNLGILCDLYLNDLECALDQYEVYSKAMPEDDKVKLWIADLRARLGRD